MAGAAAPQLSQFETHEALGARPHLSLVPDTHQQPEIIAADAIPELQFARQRAGQEAAEILGRNREMLYGGDVENVPRPVDALGTVREVVEAKRRFGPNSPEYQEKFEGLMLDSERLLGEAYAKNTSEYFAKTFQRFDTNIGEYLAHGLSIRRMVTSGLSPLANQEEQTRRQNEYVEERTFEAIGTTIARLGIHGMFQKLPEELITNKPETAPEATGLTVRTISECTDAALESYAINPKASHGGYAPGINKFMIRGVSFTETGDRYEEQVAVPGIYITHDVITAVLTEKGAITKGENPTKTEVHATQLISVNGDGVMELVRDLDAKASQISGKNIFLGEEVATDHDMDYDAFVDNAEIRRKRLAPKPRELAEYLVTLEENDTDSRVAEVKVNAWLKEVLLEVANKNPDLAEAMFDKETADGFREVATLRAQGRNNEAQWLQAEVEKNAPEVEYCGAGGSNLASIQNILNGNSDSSETSSAGRDQYGSLIFKCRNGHSNTRPRNRLIPHCKTCGVSVKC